MHLENTGLDLTNKLILKSRQFNNDNVGKRTCDVPVTQRHGNYISGKS